jgi:hypothetical protein
MRCSSAGGCGTFAGMAVADIRKWNDGMLEDWNDEKIGCSHVGMIEERSFASFQYSCIPIFQYSSSS